MLPPQGRCLSLEEASLGEGRLTGERTEQENATCQGDCFRIIMAYYFYKTILWRSFAHLQTFCTDHLHMHKSSMYA